MKLSDVARNLAPHSDHQDDDRPTVGEKTLTQHVQRMLRQGGGTPAERAHVAAGLIRAKVERWYRLEATS